MDGLDIITGITAQIRIAINGISGEEHYPSRTPDESGDYIKRSKERVKTLRRLREELEDVLWSVQ